MYSILHLKCEGSINVSMTNLIVIATIILNNNNNNINNNENDVLIQKVTQAYLEKKKSDCSYQESNLRPSDY